MPARVVVVGAGISGVACARVVAAAGHAVRLLDRGRRVGGRMAARTLDTRVGPHVTDIGASYLTVTDAGFGAVVDDWVARGLARAWTDTFAVHERGALGPGRPGPVRFAARRGLRSLVEDLAGELDVTSEHVVAGIRPVAGGVLVDTERCDVAVLAMPDVQAARLLPAELTDRLRGGEPWPWAPVLAVSAVWAERWWPDVEGVFVNDSEVLTWLADDGRRRGDGAPVLVAHTSPGFAARHLDDPEAAVAPVLDEVARLLGGLAADVPRAELATAHRWRLAQPERERPAPPFALDETGVGVCGDAWGERARVEGAWLSGTRLGHEVVRRLG